MGLKKIVDGAYLVPLGMANAVLLDGGPELALVDAGFPDKASLVFDAIQQLGRTPCDLRHLIFTHGHPDHIGSAAAIVWFAPAALGSVQTRAGAHDLKSALIPGWPDFFGSPKI